MRIDTYYIIFYRYYLKKTNVCQVNTNNNNSHSKTEQFHI